MPRTELSRSSDHVEDETDGAFWFIGKKQLIPAGVIFDESKIRAHSRHH
jgi:hypothetical protein